MGAPSADRPSITNAAWLGADMTQERNLARKRSKDETFVSLIRLVTFHFPGPRFLFFRQISSELSTSGHYLSLPLRLSPHDSNFFSFRKIRLRSCNEGFKNAGWTLQTCIFLLGAKPSKELEATIFVVKKGLAR